MVRTVIKVHFVTGFDTNTKPADEALDSATRIEHAVGITVFDPSESAGKRVAAAEVQDSALQDDERAEGAVQKIDLRSEETVHKAQFRSCNPSAATRGPAESAAEVPVPVVGTFNFKLDVGMNIETDSSPSTVEVLASGIQPGEVEKGTDFAVIQVVTILRKQGGCHQQRPTHR